MVVSLSKFQISLGKQLTRFVMLQLTEYRKSEKKNRIKLQCSSNENSHELRHVSGLSDVLETFSNFFYLKTWLQVVYLYVKPGFRILLTYLWLCCGENWKCLAICSSGSLWASAMNRWHTQICAAENANWHCYSVTFIFQYKMTRITILKISLNDITNEGRILLNHFPYS